MTQILETNRQQVIALCQRFHVRRLEVFGSATTNDFDPVRSDVDFLVEFVADAPQRALDAYFGLKEALEELLGRPVDLVMPSAIVNPYFRANMDRTREIVYAA